MEAVNTRINHENVNKPSLYFENEANNTSFIRKNKVQEKEKENEHTKTEYVELEKSISHHVLVC